MFYKCENAQLTGSFKLRGASNKIMLHQRAMRCSGAVAASTGNHGIAVAFAARAAGVRAAVFVPNNCTPEKQVGAALHTAA